MTPPEFSLRGKTAVITGALGLLGRDFARALADAGASTVVTDLDADACASFAAELAEAAGSPCDGAALDVVDPRSIRAVRDRVLERFGTIDVLVNNAAINDKVEDPAAGPDAARFENYPLDLWRRCLDVNVTGAFLCAQILGTVMAARGSGSIVNIASTYGLVAPDQSLYARPDGTQAFYKSAVYPAAKGAILSFTRFLAAYWGSAGVRVNALTPGGVEAGQDESFRRNYARRTPLGRMAHPEDYRGALVFLASDASRYMTGANLVVDGGWTAW